MAHRVWMVARCMAHVGWMVVCCTLGVVCCMSSVAWFVSPVALFPGACCMLRGVRHRVGCTFASGLLHAVPCVSAALPTAGLCLLHVLCCISHDCTLLPVAYCTLHVACCLLSIACCTLSVACRLRHFRPLDACRLFSIAERHSAVTRAAHRGGASQLSASVAGEAHCSVDRGVRVGSKRDGVVAGCCARA
jgi:hypothetical protein